MEVTLSKQSWHYALNRWSFEKEPQTWSLCPYFWMTIYAILTAPFRAIIRYLIVRPLEWIFVPRGERRWEDRKSKSAPRPVTKISAYLEKTEVIVRRSLSVIITVGFLSIFIGALAYGIFKEGWKALAEMAILIGLSVGIAIFVVFITWVFSKLGSTDAWIGIKGMFYAVKNKVCPAINWKETNQNI